jgi:hypothetical protein
MRTLDLLKSGSSASAKSARSAARYIEHATRHSRPVVGTTPPRIRGVRLQKDNETIPPSSVSILPVNETDLPKWLAAVLGCAAYFTKQAAEGTAQEEVSGAVLFVANPPLSVEVDLTRDEKEGVSERGEGYLVSQEAERFEIALEVLRDEDDEEMGMEGVGASHRGRGGKGRGGRGRGDVRARGGGGRTGLRGRGSGSEPEREVKILLRRPVSDTQGSGTGSPNGEYKSPLPASASGGPSEMSEVSPLIAPPQLQAARLPPPRASGPAPKLASTLAALPNAPGHHMHSHGPHASPHPPSDRGIHQLPPPPHLNPRPPASPRQIHPEPLRKPPGSPRRHEFQLLQRPTGDAIRGGGRGMADLGFRGGRGRGGFGGDEPGHMRPPPDDGFGRGRGGGIGPGLGSGRGGRGGFTLLQRPPPPPPVVDLPRGNAPPGRGRGGGFVLLQRPK